MKKYIISLTILIAVLITYEALPVHARNSQLGQQYSYNYDFWGEDREAPNPYSVDRVLMGNDLGIGNFRDPQGLFVGGLGGKRIYIVDTGNNRIVELDSGYNLLRIIDTFNLNGREDTFSGPNDVFVCRDGHIYVADTGNQRVVHIDDDLNTVKIIEKPDDALMNEIAEFLPTKLVVDNADRVYLLARHVNRGIMEFDSRGSFTGYLGANRVNFNLLDMMWRFLSTRTQREQMALFVPTEYNNIALDHKGFLYTTTAFFSEEDLMNLAFTGFDDDENILTRILGSSSNIEPIRRLNAMGDDILIRNGWVTPLGDWLWSDAGGISGPSRLVDIVATEQDSYFAIDRNRGRIFGFDFQGNILFIFGGLGSRAGYFQFPTAIEYIDGSILVMDGRSGGMTVFNPTEYGQLIHDALSEYKKGNYEYSAELWGRSLVYNANQDLAYIGLGRALMRQDRFEEAMYYFSLKLDRENYSKAFQQYRKQVIEDNINYMIIGVFVLIISWSVYKQVRKFRAYLKEGGS